MRNRIDVSAESHSPLRVSIHEPMPAVIAVPERPGPAGFSEAFVCARFENTEGTLPSNVRIFFTAPDEIRQFANELNAAADKIEKEKVCVTH